MTPKLVMGSDLVVYSRDLNLSIARRLLDHCSAYQVEILAIMDVADLLKNNFSTSDRIVSRPLNL